MYSTFHNPHIPSHPIFGLDFSQFFQSVSPTKLSGRRKRLHGYECVPVASCSRYMGSKGSRGWTGEPESDIPTQLFPKHVQVLASTLPKHAQVLYSALPQTCPGTGPSSSPNMSRYWSQLFPKHVQVLYSALPQTCAGTGPSSSQTCSGISPSSAPHMSRYWPQLFPNMFRY
jgi:hypothetical protein